MLQKCEDEACSWMTLGEARKAETCTRLRERMFMKQNKSHWC